MENSYLNKHRLYPPLIGNEVCSDTHIIVVIPCYFEENTLETIDSLIGCDEPKCTVEIIVVINSSLGDNEEVKKQNKNTEELILNHVRDRVVNKRRFFVLNITEIPEKIAGVGVARKIGMDEAVERFQKINNPNGVIVNLDADCTCDSNYLVAIEEHFERNVSTDGCSIYYEHPLEGGKYSDEIYEGIANYELFLRYHYQGLKFTGHPFVFQTVGSSMAVRSKVYQLQGGMNKRKAGEDFYFINKISQLGNYTNLNTTVVRPSPRLSNRVPFGTGKAINNWINTGKIVPYNPRSYEELRELFQQVQSFYVDDVNTVTNDIKGLSLPLQYYLNGIGLMDQIASIKKNVATLPNFEKRFFKWFNPFVLMKFLNETREEESQPLTLVNAAQTLLRSKGLYFESNTTTELLNFYRTLEKESC